jgi:hypothetical protein
MVNGNTVFDLERAIWDLTSALSVTILISIRCAAFGGFAMVPKGKGMNMRDSGTFLCAP